MIHKEIDKEIINKLYNIMGKRKNYESPSIDRTQIQMEDSFCAGSEVSITNEKANIEVDEYASIENDVVFE